MSKRETPLLDWNKDIPKEYQEKLDKLCENALPIHIRLALEKPENQKGGVNAYDMSAMNYQTNVLEAFALGVKLGVQIESGQYTYDERGVITKTEYGEE